MMLKLSQTATDNEMMHLDVFCIAAFFFVHFFFYPPLSLYQYHPSPVNLLDPSAVGASFWSCLLVNLTRQNFFCSLSLRTFLFWMVIGNSSNIFGNTLQWVIFSHAIHGSSETLPSCYHPCGFFLVTLISFVTISNLQTTSSVTWHET